ncbi:hypothetical protein HOL63_00425 [Candidatus Peregrinibacteria bacterium]|jgi:hypothetical protein|nr:hypothetical protein [Candidatus Peregrinibacteria bacterium]MBT7337482.1 hypothetical protein [Candidatus Peregrinibacteria bacterium]
MINQSPDRQSYNKRIQETQNDIDKTDSKLDSRIDIDGMDPEEQEALKEAYIDKVNLMQGKVHRSFENIDIQRNLRSPQWRKWEKEIITVEANLLMILRKESSRLNRSNKEANATSGLDDFNKKIDSFLHEIDAIDEVHNTPAPAEKLNEKEPEKLRSADAIFHEWNVPGTDEEITEKAQKANERYGEETLRNLDATLSLYDALDPELRKKLFKQSTTVRLPQVAGQLANGTFESSPLGFLLTEDIETIEGQLLIEREEIIDVIGRKTSEVQSLKEATTETITRLCKVAGIDVGKENVLSDIYSWMANTNGKPELQKKIVGEIRDMAKKVTELQKESQDLYPQVTTIERAFNVFDTNNARNVGNAKEEAQLRYRGALEYGIPFPGDAELQKLLRPTQMNLLKGEPEKALHVSIDELNTFMEQNPNLDTLHRVDVLSLHSVRKRKVTKATFQTFTVASNPLDAFRRSKNAAFDIGGSLDTKQKTYTVLTELGTIANGDEIIAIKLPPYNGRPSEKVIAIRNTNGIVQLQDGTVIEKPDKLQPMIINSMNGDGETTYVSKETSKYLQENVNIGSKNRVILRNRDAINSKESFTGGTSIRMLDTSQLQLASRDGKGMLIIKGADGKQEESINEEFLLKGSAEHGGDVLQSIDKNPIVQGITKRAGGLQENMQNMQTMLETAMDSKATTQGAFVDQMRSYARPMLATMEDPATRQNIVQAKNLLQSELSRVKLGSYVGSGIESEIQDRIDALDGYITVLNDNQLKNALQNAMELKPEEWAEWLSTDGLIMLGAIALAIVAIVALTVLTGGAGLIAISAVGAAGGLIGGELTKEGLHHAYNTWGGAASGEYRYNDRSRFGAYLEGQKLYDPKTKEFVDMSFLENVAAPYARDFAVSFATTALALGAGQAVGNSLSKLAQNSKWIQALSKNNKVANSIMKKLSGLADDAATIPKNMKEFAGKSLKEIADELGDELVLEKSAEGVLNRIDSRLGSLATFFVAAGKGFKPMAGGKLSYGAEKKSADVRVDIESQGHTIVSEINGVFDVKTYDGKTLIIEPETVTEATSNTEALDLATQHDLAALKEYVKAHDIDDSTRITLAETVLDRTLSPADRKALITAHNKPGTIDELTPSELKVKATELRDNATFTKTERRMLIEAGLAGRPPVIGTRKGPPPPPPMRNKKRPPPAIGVMKSSPESKKDPLLPSIQLSDINVLTGDQRKAYIKSKMNNPLWIRSLGAAQRRMTVFPSKENTHHILWVKDNSGPTNTVGAKTLSYKYLMSPEGSLEHSIFLEGEKMMMKAFADAQSMFPKNVKVATGFTVESMSADTGMSHGNLLGYKVNTDNTNRLFTLIAEARKTGDYSKVESHIDWIKSAFAHETTHAARNDLDNLPGLNANEVPSHAVQFLTIWDKPDRFFSQRISSLKNKPLSSFGRIHGELGGLKVVQEKLIACSDCSYKPKDLTPVELKKAIESIPEAKRGSVIDTMVAELVTTPVADFQANVRTVFDESQK